MAPKPDKDLARRQALREAVAAGPEDAALKALRAALAGRSGLLTDLAARLTEEGGHRVLGPELEGAFRRLSDQGLKHDPGCRGKLAALKALRTLEIPAFDLFTEAAAYVQMEPSWGPPEDSAAPVRAVAGACLGELGHPDAILWLAQLLGDVQHRVRAAAAEALGNLGRPEVTPLLLYATLKGDPEPEVLGALLRALLYVAAVDALPFIGHLLDHPDEAMATEVALSLGECPHPEATEKLLQTLESARAPERRQLMITALALQRREEALGPLVELVAEGMTDDALRVVKALEIYSFDDDLRGRLLAAAEVQEREEITHAIRLAFPR